jgi:tetratricopeptide (TPR) repeat protein
MSEQGREHNDARLEQRVTPVRRPSAEPLPAPAAGPAWLRPALLTLVTALMVAGIVWVFVLLPDRAQQPEPEPAPVVDAQLPAVPVLSEAELAALTDAAESLLAVLLEQQQDLNLRSVSSWGDTTWSSYEAASERGDQALLDGDPQTAVEQYQLALDIGESLLEYSNRIVREALAAGEQAILSGDAELAASQFELVLGIDPDNAAALAGLARANTLPDVLDAMTRGDEAEAAGNLDAAATAYRQAIAADPDFAAARNALAAVNQRIEDSRFERLLNEAFAATEAARYEQAAELFAEALQLNPDSPAARDGLAQAEQGMQSDAIVMAEVRARAFERRELWDQAIERYQEALATDPTLAFAIEGLERAQVRADLDAKLLALTGEPARLLDEAVLNDATAILATAQAIDDAGPRLTEQRTLLARLIELAVTPIQVTLISDEQTAVTVYRVGDLGSFAAREIALKPGRYTAVGQRRGYFDVRETFVVLPGDVPGPITVICTERI